MNKFTQQGSIKEVKASIINPINAGLKLIINLCSVNGKFENTLDKRLSKQWARTREEFKGWHANQLNFRLGEIMHMLVSSEIWVASLLVKNADNNVDIKALNSAINKLSKLAIYEKASIHCSDILLNECPDLMPLLVKEVAGNGTHLYIYSDPIK